MLYHLYIITFLLSSLCLSATWAPSKGHNKKDLLVFLTNSLKSFQSAKDLEAWYMFSSILHSSFHQALEYLVILIYLENLFQRYFEMFAYSWIVFSSESICQAWFTPEWKSAEWTQRWVDLWNDLSFSLCAAPSVCHMVTTSDDRKKSEMRVSADWCVAIEHQRLSSIRDYLRCLLD